MYSTPTHDYLRGLDVADMQKLLERGWQRTADDFWFNPIDGEKYTRAAALSISEKLNGENND